MPEPPAHRRGPLRAAVAVFLAGVLVVWLIKPIGDPCPDLARLPQGSSASSSPSLSPPATRTCTYTAAGGTQATSTYVPWLDWIVLLLVAGLAAGAVRLASAAGRTAREPRATRAPRPAREPGPARKRREPRAPAASPERDAAARERARRERAERDR